MTRYETVTASVTSAESKSGELLSVETDITGTGLDLGGRESSGSLNYKVVRL